MRWKIPREVVVGFLAIVTIALLVWGIDFLKQSNLFSEKNNYFIVYNEIDGLVESGEVVLNGLKIGNVSKITYDQKSKGILVEINLEDNYRLPKFTRAEIFSADLMGTKAIRLDFGLGKEGYHPVGDYLLPSREPSLQDKVGQEMLPVKIKAEELMMEMQRVLEIVKYIFNENTRENLSKSFESIKITLNNLENSSVSLDTLLGQGSGKIQRILSNIESISSNLRDNNDKLANIITNFDNISDSLAKSEITSTINNADLALKQANSILNKIHRGEGTIGMLINNDTLYNNLENAAHNLDELLVDLKENPKRYIHYSLFDFGRTFYVAKDEANAIQMKEGSEELEKFSKELKKHEASPSRVSDKDLKRIDQK
ncbi:MAG: MCE family protein, partial [Marinilabiliales bacterium]